MTGPFVAAVYSSASSVFVIRPSGAARRPSSLAQYNLGAPVDVIAPFGVNKFFQLLGFAHYNVRRARAASIIVCAAAGAALVVWGQALNGARPASPSARRRRG